MRACKSKQKGKYVTGYKNILVLTAEDEAE